MANEQTSVPLYAASEVLTAANMNISAGTGVPVFATTVTRDAAFGGANEKVLAEGQLCYLSSTNVVQYYDGAAWATVGPATSSTSRVWLNTHNGYGSSSTVIPRYTTTVVNSGTDITYADSATLGSTFTINTAGMYACSVGINSPISAFCEIGISLNSTQLTTGINAITGSTALARAFTTAVVSTSTNIFASATFYFAVNDVIRPHGGGQVPNSTNTAFFLIARVN